MPKSTLILVHGMGKPSDEMFEEWEATLKAEYETYTDKERVEDRFDCFSIEYDSVFEERRDQWNKQIDSILNSGVSGVDLPSKEELESITEDNFYTTHIQDVLLYKYVPQVAEDIRANVVAQLNDIIQEAHDSSNVSVIAHSLGTSVIHDAINALYETPDENEEYLSPQVFRFHTIAMIANVSRTLETRWEAFDSLVKPGWDNSENYVTDYFLSSSHKWDPLVCLRRFFAIENWPDSKTVMQGRVEVVEPSIINRVNLHDFSHYIENPRVHIPLFRMLRHPRFITKTEEAGAIQAYYDASPIGLWDEYRNELKSVMYGEADFSWERLFSVLKKYWKLVNEFTS